MKQSFVWLGSLAVVAAVVSIGASLGWWKYQQITAAAAAPPPPENPIAVVVEPSTQVSYRAQTTSIGTVLAPQSIKLSNEVAGSVNMIGFKSGDIVEAGQVLLQLDTTVEQARLASAEARAKIAKSTLNRTREAAANRAVAELELEEADARYSQALAEVEELRAVISRKTLRAPFRAKIGICNTHVGQFLMSGADITSLQSIEGYVNVDFMVPQSAADSVQVGKSVIIFDQSDKWEAKIAAIDAQADRTTRNLMARAKLEPVPPQLLPGDSVKVAVDYGPVLTTAAVPLEAVRRAPMRSFVYVVTKDKSDQLRAREQTRHRRADDR